MHRRLLLDVLDRYRELHPEESAVAEQIASFARAHSDCFERTCLPGHVTGSAWIVSADHRQVLLTHHRKLDRWLQLGGHADGDPDPFRVALREAREESGLATLAPLPDGTGLLPLDLDVHRIPARGREPEHLHHDVRYLLVAAPGQELVRSDESHDLRWFERSDLLDRLDEESLRRMDRKASARLARLA